MHIVSVELIDCDDPVSVCDIAIADDKSFLLENGIIAHNSDICRQRDGKQWTSDTQAPIGHALPFLPPPCHFGCRSMLLLALVDVPVMAQAAQPLRAFVARQSVREQRAMLGTAAFRQWEAGTLDETALVQALTRRALPFETHEGAIV